MSNIDIGDLNLSDLGDFDLSDYGFEPPANTGASDSNTMGSLSDEDYNDSFEDFYRTLLGREVPSAAEWYAAFERASSQQFIDASVQIIYQSIQDAALARLSLIQSSMLAQVQAGNDVITRPSLGDAEGGEAYQAFWEEFSGPMNTYLDNLFGDADSITREELLDNPEFVETGIRLATSWSTNANGDVSWSTTNQDQVDTYVNLDKDRQAEIAQQEADTAAEEERQAAITNAGNIFSDLGYEATQEEKEQFADNPDGIADYVDPRQVTTEEARQVLNDAGIPDSVLDGEFAERWATVINGATGQGDENFQSTVNTNIGDYADKRIVTEAEAREYFEDLGYEPSPEEIADFVGVIDDPMRTDNYDTRNNVGDYVDPRQITEEEAQQFFEDLGYVPNAEEIQDFIGQGDENFQSSRSAELGTYVDEHQVTRAELEQIAAEQGYELDPDDDYGQYIRQGAGIDQADIKANAERDFDEGATSVEEVQEIYRRRAGVDISDAEAQALLDLAILEGDGSPNLSEEGFGGWATENIEVDLRQHLENLGEGVLNILFGSTDVEEILQQQMEILLPPSPSDPNYEEKYNEWLKRQGDAIISINNSPATSGTWAGVRFPVPIPVSGPEIRIPIFDAEGNYQGPSSVGELLVGENGVVTQVIDGIETQIGEIKETGIEIFGEDGQGGVLGQIIDLGQATIDAATGQATFTPENPDIQFNEETGQIIQPETEDNTGPPLDEKEDEDEPPDAEGIEEDAYDGVFNNDVDGDGIPNDQDEFPNDPNNGVDPDAPDEDPDGTGEVDPVDPDDTDEGTTDTSDDIPEGDRVAYLSDVEGAKEEVLAEIGNPEDGTGLWGELNALGLENDEITALLGNPSGVDEDGNPIEAQGLYALVEGAATSDELTAAITQIEGFIGQPQYAEDGTTIIGGTGLFGLYDETQDIKDVLGEPQYDEEGNLTSDSTGIFSDLYNQQQAITNLNDLSPEQVRDIVDAALEDYDFENLTQTEVEDIVADALEEYGFENLSEQDVKDIVGEPERDDEGNLTGGTGIYGDLYAQQQDITNLTTLVSNLNNLSTSDVRTVVENILTEQGLDSLNDLSEEQVEAIVDRIVGSPATDDEDASGLYALVGNLNDLSEDDVTRIVTTALGDLEDLSKEDVTGIVNDIVGTPATDDEDASGLFALLEGQQAQISEVTDLVGEPTLNEDGEIVGGTGLYGELYAAGLRDDEILNLIGTPDNPETDENEASGLYLAYQQGTESTQNYIDDVVNPQLVSISDRVGTPDDPNTEENEATGLYLAVEEGDQAVIDYIGAPEIDPETGEIVGGTGLYADLYALGLDTDRIIELIGDPESETGLYGLIGSPAIPDDPNTPEDESRPGTGVYGQIDAFAGDISDQIDTSQEETNQYLDYISGVIGRPASELTQDDVDMVIDLLAEDEFISDFNNDVRLYDVNFDGQIDQSDIGLLQGFVDAGVEGIGEIPATGIYADAARRQEEITGSIADQAGETRELIGDEAAETRRIVGQQNLFNALLGSGDLMGRQVDVKTPDPVQLKYIYDFSDIFATPQQRSLFPSPYGAPQRQAAQQVAQQRGIMSGPLNLGGLQGRPGMAAGGKVDYDFTDEIMHIMSYGDS